MEQVRRTWRDLVEPIRKMRAFRGGCHWHCVVCDGNVAQQFRDSSMAQAETDGCDRCGKFGNFLRGFSTTQLRKALAHA